MPEIEKKIAKKIRSEQPVASSDGDNNLNREQVELINDLKHREVKHVDHIHKLEKVSNYGPLHSTSFKFDAWENRMTSWRCVTISAARGTFFEVQGMKFNLNESRPAGERFIGFDVDFAL